MTQFEEPDDLDEFIAEQCAEDPVFALHYEERRIVMGRVGRL